MQFASPTKEIPSPPPPAGPQDPPFAATGCSNGRPRRRRGPRPHSGGQDNPTSLDGAALSRDSWCHLTRLEPQLPPQPQDPGAPHHASPCSASSTSAHLVPTSCRTTLSAVPRRPPPSPPALTTACSPPMSSPFHPSWRRSWSAALLCATSGCKSSSWSSRALPTGWGRSSRPTQVHLSPPPRPH